MARPKGPQAEGDEVASTRTPPGGRTGAQAHAPEALDSGILNIAKQSVLLLAEAGPDLAPVRIALEKRGMQVFAVNDARDAEAVAYLPRYAIIETRIPGALRLLRRITAAPQEALALAVLDEGGSETEALKGGAQATLRRPLQSADVLLYLSRFERHAELVTRSRELFERNEANALVSTTARIAAALAHEIRNPLAAARLNLGMLREAATPSPRASVLSEGEQREMLDEIDAALARIEGILSSVATLARGEKPEVTRVNLHDVAERALRSVPNARGVAVELSGDRAIDGYASRGLLEQVIVNLVTNALDAVQAAPDPQILVRVYATVSEARISVRDNGPGVTPEHRDRIFEPFFSTKGSKGTGLGLAISRQAIASMGGALTLAADAGTRGACFRVRLRRA